MTIWLTYDQAGQAVFRALRPAPVRRFFAEIHLKTRSVAIIASQILASEVLVLTGVTLFSRRPTGRTGGFFRLIFSGPTQATPPPQFALSP